MARPTLRQLEYVVAIHEQGSFTDAARSLGVTQPALSNQVRRLEDSLRVALFERGPSGVVATSAGVEVVELSRRVLGTMDDVVAVARAMQDPLRGTVRMGVIPTVAPYMLPSVTERIRERFPDIRLLLREERTARLTSLLHEGRLDVLLVALESELGDVEVRPLFTDPFVLAVPEGHRLCQARRVALADLVGERVLLLEDGHCLRDQARAICDSAGAGELGDFRATSLSTLVHMVASGTGITMLPTMAVHASEHLGRSLRLITFQQPVPGRTIALAWRRTSPLRSSFETLARTLSGPRD